MAGGGIAGPGAAAHCGGRGPAAVGEQCRLPRPCGPATVGGARRAGGVGPHLGGCVAAAGHRPGSGAGEEPAAAVTGADRGAAFLAAAVAGATRDRDAAGAQRRGARERAGGGGRGLRQGAARRQERRPRQPRWFWPGLVAAPDRARSRDLGLCQGWQYHDRRTGAARPRRLAAIGEGGSATRPVPGGAGFPDAWRGQLDAACRHRRRHRQGADPGPTRRQGSFRGQRAIGDEQRGALGPDRAQPHAHGAPGGPDHAARRGRRGAHYRRHRPEPDPLHRAPCGAARHRPGTGGEDGGNESQRRNADRHPGRNPGDTWPRACN